MCGHVGVAGDLRGNHTKAFRDMLFIDTLRGPHGTGVGSVPFRGDRTVQRLAVQKLPIPAYQALENSAFEKAASDASAAVLIGHNRHATVGSHVVGNTHPFIQGTILGAHNGTVSSHNRKLDVGGKTFGTDSEEIFASINLHGVKDTVAEMRSCAQGAWALVWYDVEQDELNFLRNAERPFFYAFNEDRSVLMWASESSMITFAANRRDIKLDKVYQLPVDVHFRWAVPKTGEVFGKEVRAKCPGKKWTAPRTTRTATTTTYTGPYNRGSSSTASNALLRLPASFDVELENFAKFDDSNVVSMYATNEGCAWCGCKVTQKDLTDKKAVAISRESVVCEEHKLLPTIFQSIIKRQKTEDEIEERKSNQAKAST